MLPWALYNLTPRDQASPLIRPYHEYKTATLGAGTSHTHEFTVPADYVLLVTCISMIVSSPNAALTVESWVTDVPTTVFHHYTKKSVDGLAPVGKLEQNLIGSPLFMVNETQRILTKHSIVAFGAAWDAVASVSGVMIPRGTLSFT